MHKGWVLLIAAGSAVSCAGQTVQPSFLDRLDYRAASYTVAVRDVNHDGIPDLVSGNLDGGIAVQFGNGDGTFRPGPLLSVQPYSVFSLTLADINKDGNLDVVFATSTGVGLSFGNGDGTFQAPLFYSVGALEENEAIAVGDFNGDGIPDAATPGRSGVWILLGMAGGGFSAPQLIPVSGAGGLMIVVGDLNGDGKLDVVAGASPGIVVLLGKGDGTFGPPIGYSIPTGGNSLTLADLNGDGNLDLATVGQHSAYASILLGNGDGTFQSPTTTYLPGGFSIAAGDVNGHGIPDLVTQDVSVAFGNGDGTFQKPVFFAAGASAGAAGLTGTQVVLAKLKKKGGLDIVTANNAFATVSVLLNDGHGKFIDGEYLKVSGQPQCAQTADFNGDGKPDLAFGNGQGATVLLGTGKAKPAYSLPGTQVSVAGGYCVATGDFNNDGFTDLAVLATNGQIGNGAIAIFLGRGDGSFVPGATINLNAAPGVAAAVADFNHDGNLDIAVSGNLLLFGNGDGTFQIPVPFVPNPGLYASFAGLASGHLKADGAPDIVIVDFVHNLVYELLNRGNGTFNQRTFTPPICASPLVPRLADLNGDGNTDLAVLCQSNAVVTYLGNGDGTFQPPTSVPGFWTPYSYDLLVTDLSGDGSPDLAVTGDHSVFVYTGNGDGTFNPMPVLFGAGPTPASLAASHLHQKANSSGKPDISVVDFTGSVLVLLNTTP